MEKKFNRTEIIIWLFIALPIVYMVSVWNNLPELVPIHFNSEGIPDNWTSKKNQLITIVSLLLGVYALLLLIPKIDPKKGINKMGSKYQNIKMILMIFLSSVSLYLVNSSLDNQLTEPYIIFIIFGFLFIFIGNYFQSIKTNYFVGIRTPWTLENETVWRKTHKVGGYFFMAGGILIIVFALLLKNEARIPFISITVLVSLVPIAYSYIVYKQLSIKNDNELNS